MKNFFLNDLKYEKKIDIILLFLVIFLPLSLLCRSLIINAFTILIPLIFLIKIINEKKLFILNNKIFWSLLIFWLILLLNSFFSINFYESFSRAFGFLRFIILVFAIKFIISYKNFKFEKIIYSIWFSTFFIVSSDLIFEYIFGFNVLGFQSNWPGRLSGFLDQELKIGNFYYGFILIALSFVYKNYRNKQIFFILAIFFIFISFVIGERSNFIRSAFLLILFLLIFIENSWWKKIFILLSSIIFIFVIINSNPYYKARYWDQIIFPIKSSSNFSIAMKETTYGAHYYTAIKIFKENLFFGVGLRNYRNESWKEKYNDETLKFNNSRWSTHPHQLHLEFLSETGLIGYTSFLILFFYYLLNSFKSYLKNKNIYQLSSILFIIVSLLPIIPSGSFFTTFGATIFWINFSVMTTYNLVNKNNS